MLSNFCGLRSEWKIKVSVCFYFRDSGSTFWLVKGSNQKNENITIDLVQLEMKIYGSMETEDFIASFYGQFMVGQIEEVYDSFGLLIL